ncbi:tRNA pseudouridine(55) synthase TruB [Ectothiorhodospiraceae bacterium BW-2]|nr:tRNA pseudouridine(55) synthase TruB [Ectothiorhodospiraceae bacterium BW-2]
MGRRRPKGRPVNGILLLNKPIGATSNHALQQVKRLYQAAKAGHTGNLDPLASGMLPICFGEATKYSAFLLDATKRYVGTCQLGVTTTTADAEGEVIESCDVPPLSLAQIESVLEQFRGEIEQLPPMYSALKHKGQPLYKLAREGKEIERQPRRVTIYELTLQQQRQDALLLEVFCSKGTYIRTLVEDIGKQLGCGAHLSQLERTAVGPFQASEMVTMAQLESVQSPAEREQWLVGLDRAVADFTPLSVTPTGEFYLQQGQPIQIAAAPASGWVRLYSGDGRFIGVGVVLDDGRIGPKRIIQH